MTKSDYHVLLISIDGAWKHGNIGIDQLAGYLRLNGFNIEMGYFQKKTPVEEIFNNIKGKSKFYGFSVTSSNYSMCIDLSTMLKEDNPDVIIDFGGGYVTRYYREVFSEVLSLDYITLGDGEEPTKFLLNKLINEPDYRFQQFTGHSSVVSRYDTQDKIQFLNKKISHFPVYDYYKKDTATRNSRKVHCIQTKNNVCTGNCSFCTERHGKVIYKDIQLIIDQIKEVHDRFGIHKIFFTDDNIFDSNDNDGRKHVYDLCIALKKLNYKMAFQCYCKANSLHDTPEDHALLSLMKEIGFVEVFVGIESGNDEDLILYNKYTTVKDNYTIMKLLHEHGLTPIMGFIGFNPYSTPEKLRNNFKFLCDVHCTYLPNYLYTFVNVNKYTSLYEKIKADGLVLSDEKEYINIKYNYADSRVAPILKYIEDVMIDKLNKIDYELDWVCYSYEECKIWYEKIEDLTAELEQFKNEDFDIIQKYLSILFIEQNLENFIVVENEFWKHFQDREKRLKEMYDYLISIHKRYI